MDEYIDEEELKKIRKIHGYISSEEESDDALTAQHDELYERYKPPPVEIDPEKHKIIEVGSSEEAARVTYAGVLKKALDLNLDESKPPDDGQTSKKRKKRKKKKGIASNSDEKELPKVSRISGIGGNLQEAILSDDGKKRKKKKGKKVIASNSDQKELLKVSRINGIGGNFQEAILPDDGKKRKKKKGKKVIASNSDEKELPNITPNIAKSVNRIVDDLQEAIQLDEVEPQATLPNEVEPQEVKKNKKRNRGKKKGNKNQTISDDFENTCTILRDLSNQLDCRITKTTTDISAQVEVYLNAVDSLGIPLLHCTRCVASIIQRTEILTKNFTRHNMRKVLNSKKFQKLFYDTETVIFDAVTTGNYGSDFHVAQVPVQKLIYECLSKIMINLIGTTVMAASIITRFDCSNYLPPLALFENLEHVADFIRQKRLSVSPTKKQKAQSQKQLQPCVVEDLTFSQYDFGSNHEAWEKFKDKNGPGVSRNDTKLRLDLNKKCLSICPTKKLKGPPTQPSVISNDLDGSGFSEDNPESLLQGSKMNLVDYPIHSLLESGSAHIFGLGLLIVFKNVVIELLAWMEI